MQTIERENRNNGNQEGTREEGRKEGREEEVTAVNQQQGNTQRGTQKSVPLSVCAEGLDSLGREPGRREPILEQP